MRSPSPGAARIAVIGAGPGGLTCARILQRHGLRVTVYDRDREAHARDQGGTLDLHADNGQIALRHAGLLAEFLAAARPEGQEMRLTDHTGAIRHHDVPAPGDTFKPEIDRGDLRDLLLNSLRPGTVQWGHDLRTVTAPVDGLRRLHFAGGATTDADLVIGADGAFSRVRTLVSDAVPAYTGVTFLEAWFDDVETRHPELGRLVGPGSAFAISGGRGLLAQRNSGEHIRVYIALRVPRDANTPAGIDLTDTEAARACLLDLFPGWDPLLLRMITDNDGPYVDRPLYALPISHTWTHNPTVTLLGDAAHLMPPLGVGVNLAMLDAAELALALRDSDSIADAIHAYENVMLPRSAGVARECAEGLDGLLAPTPDHAHHHLTADR
ncbi:FAD-dependent oxidoreductase [Amycolatopsis jiangsuensis]|uniref:Flavin-dependent monooxygenase n=1 Tax=Amycolatopsis jiangsuensis TaxID=1181879 RepID=A0A840ITR1_9PSEU|nr:NAD(P)/FAD-dependent oxidoreductase [Amycolatopsis jiangsuensis]MBB4686041.1 2-polyprenyl-6-methoxyphenol hydroxylase-like FAD-dependent oxidoreductase [Amycolatopsis jiangsuensis]